MGSLMAFVTWSLVGGALGWVIKKEERHRAAKSLGVHLSLGVVSAILGGLLLGSFFPIPRNTDGSVVAFDFVLVNVFLAIVGAMVSFCILQYRLPNRSTTS